MLHYSVKKVVEDVRVALDENINGARLPGGMSPLEDVDTLSLDAIIRSKIEDAARLVELNAPLSMLDADEGKEFENEQISHIVGLGKGATIPLPDDFLRLIRFRMSDWARPVTEAITVHDKRYAMQQSPCYGVHGNPDKPVVAVTGIYNDDEREIIRVLELYTTGNDSYVKEALYIPYPRIEEKEEGDPDTEGIWLCNRFYRPVIYYCAYLVAATLGDKERADILASEYKEMTGADETGGE